MYQRESEEVRARENAARGEKTAYEIVAEKTAALAGGQLKEEQRKKAGMAIHWWLGTSTGALYGVLRGRFDRLGIGSGLAYGLAVFLLLDGAALTILGIAPPPRQFPWQTHARGLAGHLMLGAVNESVFDVIDLRE